MAKDLLHAGRGIWRGDDSEKFDALKFLKSPSWWVVFLIGNSTKWSTFSFRLMSAPFWKDQSENTTPNFPKCLMYIELIYLSRLRMDVDLIGSLWVRMYIYIYMYIYIFFKNIYIYIYIRYRVINGNHTLLTGCFWGLSTIKVESPPMMISFSFADFVDRRTLYSRMSSKNEWLDSVL